MGSISACEFRRPACGHGKNRYARSAPTLIGIDRVSASAKIDASTAEPIPLADLMQYKEAREQASEQAMAELAQQSQELGMGYE